jgi:NAD(P)-dependent dehydrogenase (short-subunit alcohol dehydrogenase family)
VFVSSDTNDPEANTGMPHPQYQDAKSLAFPSNGEQAMSLINDGRIRYTTSKLCNIFCAYELSRRLQKQGLNITANCFNPSLMIDTNFYNQAKSSTPAVVISTSILEKARDSSDMGNALARLILDPALEEITGKYFDGFDMIHSSTESYDEFKATELWESSAEIVKLSPRRVSLSQ